jgi:hypothetical protein
MPENSNNPDGILETKVSRRDAIKAGVFALLHPKPIENKALETKSHNIEPIWTNDKTPDRVKSYIRGIISNPPKIDGLENSGKPLDVGFGWATYQYALERGSKILEVHLNRGKFIRHRLSQNNELPTPAESRVLEISPQNSSEQELLKLAKDKIIESQSELSPQEALDQNKYLGYVATRGKDDIGKRLLLWTVSNPGENPQLKFIGVVLVTDNSGHDENLNKPYKLDNWNLPWMLDVSDTVLPHLPQGRAPSPDYAMAGRPGIIAISEDFYSKNLTENKTTTKDPL